MPATKSWFVYLVRCSDRTYYCGVTNNKKKRLAAHNAGTGAKYTRSRRPVVLVWSRRCRTKSLAFQAEYATKLLRRAQKRRLIGS